MNDDTKAEEMIRSGTAMDAEKWLLENLDKRRIGESATPTGRTPLDKLHQGTSIVKEWVSDIRIDDCGNEFANLVIFELPKRGRKGIFAGINIRLCLSGLPVIEDTGQRYIICPEPSALQVELAKQRIKEL